MIKTKFKGEIITIPTKKQTQDIIAEIAKIKNIPKEKLLLNYNSINISPHSKYNLDDIGFCLNDTINIEDFDVKKGYFKILPFNFIDNHEINNCTNAFSIKKYFAKEFFTVPKNIIIKFDNKILSDEQLLYEYIDQNIPFEIEVEQNYTLYYAYYGQFRFICMPNESTLENLEDTVSIYTENYENRIAKHFFSKQVDNKKKMLKELSKNIQLFKFVDDPYHSEQIIYYNGCIRGQIKVHDNHKTLYLEVFYANETNVYTLMCYLERYFGIERKLFLPFNEKEDQISCEAIINRDQNTNLTFKISSVLKVKINGTYKSFSYLENIDDIKKTYKFDDNNFGIIINNQFACCEDINYQINDNLLVHFLNNSNDSTAEIKIQKSKNSCHERKFVKSSEKGYSTHYFLVPDDMSNDQIAIKYFGINKDAIKFHTENYDFKYTYNTSRSIHFNFIDERNQKWNYQRIVPHLQPQIIDLLMNLFEYRTQPLSYKNLKYKATFDTRELDFYTNLSTIPYSETDQITIEEKKISEEDKELTLLVFPENIKSKIKLNPNASAQNILYENNLQGYDLYMNFNKLEFNHIPYICFVQDPILIANKPPQTNTFRVTNKSLDIKYTCDYKNYYFMSSQIKIAYGVQEYDDVKFKLLYKGKYDLPPDFHAGSFPENSQIIIKYKYIEDNKILVCYGKEKIVQINNFHSPISDAKEGIMKSLNLFDISKKAWCLSFYDKILSEYKSFSYYKINSNMKLQIIRNINSFPIKVSSKDQAFEKIYYFSKDDTISDLEEHLKFQFNVQDISITINNCKKINKNENLHPNLHLYFSTKPITILYQGYPEETKFEFDQIIKISEANNYIANYISRESSSALKELIYIYSYNEDEECYEIADFTKTLAEFEGPLFAHRILPTFSFIGYPIRYDASNIISEQNTLGWFKKFYIAKKAKTNPNELVILQSEQPVDESTPMRNLMKKIQLQIKFKNEINDLESEQEPQSQHKQIKKSVRNFKPRIKRISSINNKRNSQIKNKAVNKAKSDEGKINKDNDDNSDDTKITKTKRKTHKSENDDELNEKIKKPSNSKRANTNDDSSDEAEHKKTSKSKRTKHKDDSDDEETRDKIKKQSKKDKNNFNSKNSESSDESSEENTKKSKQKLASNEEETDNKKKKQTKSKTKTNLSDEPSDENVKKPKESKNKNKNTNNSSDSANENHSEEEDSENEANDDIQIEEEEEEGLEENNYLTCTFQISRKTPFTLSFQENDTIEDAKEKLSEREGGIDINCISIVFAGKKLKNNRFIKKLKLTKNDILQVFIFTPQTILLRSARCFHSHGRQEFDYYSDYEEDQDDYY